jgi:hypothetical protein
MSQRANTRKRSLRHDELLSPGGTSPGGGEARELKTSYAIFKVRRVYD